MDGSTFNQIEMHHLALKYASAVSLCAQQTQSKLEATVMVQPNIKGETAVAANFLGKFSTKARTGRYEATNVVDVDRFVRWFEPTLKSGAVLIDTWDKIRMDVDPEGQLVQSILGCYHRDIDDIIYKAYLAAAKTGQKAETTTNYDTAMTVTADEGGGDILKKINLAQQRIQSKDVDVEQEELFMLVPPVGETQLKEAGIYISSDYNDNKPLAGKKLTPYAGINFVRYNFAPTGGKYICPVYCKSGLALGKWLNITIKFSERGDLSHAKQIYAEYSLGATRLEEAKCAAIEITAA